MKIYGKAQQHIEKLIDQFRTGDIVSICAKSVITADNIPSAKWTMLNRVMAMSQSGDADCRGFRQWESAGRRIKKDERAAYILRPIYVAKKSDQKKESNDDEKPEMILIGFSSVPVFGVSQTDGQPLEYEITDKKKLPALRDVADKLGISVHYDVFCDDYYGCYRPDKDKVTLCSHDESIFLHELSHAVHNRVTGGLKGGQHPNQEIVAEFCSCVLARLYGKKSANENRSYSYIKHYADKIKKNVPDAILSFMIDIVKVVDYIIDTKEELIAQAA